MKKEKLLIWKLDHSTWKIFLFCQGLKNNQFFVSNYQIKPPTMARSTSEVAFFCVHLWMDALLGTKECHSLIGTKVQLQEANFVFVFSEFLHSCYCYKKNYTNLTLAIPTNCMVSIISPTANAPIWGVHSNQLWNWP